MINWLVSLRQTNDSLADKHDGSQDHFYKVINYTSGTKHINTALVFTFYSILFNRKSNLIF